MKASNDLFFFLEWILSEREVRHARGLILFQRFESVGVVAN